jgi:hypothetical protein
VKGIMGTYSEAIKVVIVTVTSMWGLYPGKEMKNETPSAFRGRAAVERYERCQRYS